ncbi:MAG: ribosome biogenesis GTPase Der [Gemmataceae bacterium]
MAVPVVAIVGRPNVGKSSLFNWLAGKRIAIVDPTAGVTRDRITALINIQDKPIEIMDTGGIGLVDSQDLSDHVERQIQLAINRADLLLFVVDGREGLVPLDETVAERLRHVRVPVLLVVNKCDTEQIEPNAPEFYRLGHDRLVCVSAQQNRGRSELLKAIYKALPEAVEARPADPVLKLAIVGRRNVGKSTFINALSEADRMIVSEVPGTTRDSVDVRFERDGKIYLAIDTAGVRRKKSLADNLEFYSLARAERSIRRADVVLMFFDATLPVSKVDKQLGEYVWEQQKTAIFVINKWDLMRPRPTGVMTEYMRRIFPSLSHVPLAFVTAKTGKNVQQVLDLANNLHKQASARVPTGELNRVLREALLRNPPPLRMNRRAKIYYITQVATNPPHLVLFVNSTLLFDNTYVRYLTHTFRDALPFHECALRVELRARKRDDLSLEEATPDQAEALKAQAQASAAAKTKRRRRGPKKNATPELWDDV